LLLLLVLTDTGHLLTLHVSAAAGSTAAAPPTVTAAWLAGQLGDPSLVILDARPSLRDYLAGHIAGAQPLGVENIRSAAGGVPGQIFPEEVLSVILGRVGIQTSSPVVVYSAENDPDATFVASALRLHGIENVSVLDGGLKRWTQEQRPVTTERRSIAVTRPRLRKRAVDLAELGEVQRIVKEGGALLLDARPPEQYEAGRLPGAASRFWKRDLVATEGSPDAGMLRDTADLEKEYEALGVARDKPVIVYCNTGHMASEVFYTLRYRLGYPNVRLYDGSWVEWSMDPGRPVEKGPAKQK
jgi:thiosulfate/3-mercaptopyruvate sulfurtransferase